MTNDVIKSIEAEIERHEAAMVQALKAGADGAARQAAEGAEYWRERWRNAEIYRMGQRQRIESERMAAQIGGPGAAFGVGSFAKRDQ